MQQAVLQLGALHLDKVRELEYALDRARRDALVEILTLRGFALCLLLAADGERAFLGRDVDIGLGKASDGYRDAILIIAGAFDIVGRVARCTIMSGDLIEEREQPVKADGRAIEGSKIKRSHGISSFGERHAEGSAIGQTQVWYAARRGPAQIPIWALFWRLQGVARHCFVTIFKFVAAAGPRGSMDALSPSAGLL